MKHKKGDKVWVDFAGVKIEGRIKVVDDINFKVAVTKSGLSRIRPGATKITLNIGANKLSKRD